MSENRDCAECGMLCSPTEYHPFAACLMFKACNNGNQVRSNLAAVVGYGKALRDRELDAGKARGDT